MREPVYTRVKTLRAINHTSVVANGDTDGTAIGLDQSGVDFRSVMFVAMLGTRTDGTYTAVPQESANGTTGWVNVPAERLLGSAALATANGVGEVGVIPDPYNFPFVRLRVTAATVTTGAIVSAVALLGEPSGYPVWRA
jgi:hypothetical protein